MPFGQEAGIPGKKAGKEFETAAASTATADRIVLHVSCVQPSFRRSTSQTSPFTLLLEKGKSEITQLS